MKILIMGFSKLKYMPYMNLYIDNITRENNEIHFLYWNRDLKDESIPENLAGVTLHEFKSYQEDDVSKFSKINNFIKYKKYAKKIIKKEKFDFIIVLHSLPGVLLSNYLKKHYKNKYIFDFRDVTYEKFSFYKKIIAKVVNNSQYTFVSSAGFLKYLPKTEKIIISHNMLLDSLNHRDDRKNNLIKCEKVRISFWGFIRNEELNKTIINKISKDDRFELHYYGREQQVALNLKEYARQLNSSNVYFHGEYKPNDRYNFISETDIIHNLFDDSNMLLAMPNKYYDGIIFRIPQLCLSGSFMGETTNNANVGLTVNPYEDSFLEKIWDYYSHLNIKSFEKNCDNELERVLLEYNNASIIIKKCTIDDTTK